jgi:nucleoside-diphosphate-sugar epimerase
MNALVTGGGGFLGRAIVEQLLARGDRVETLSRGRYPELEALGVRCHQADLADAEAVRAACAGQDTVFHVAARVGQDGTRQQFWEANVTGTEHVIDACRAQGVARLVFTSSPSVIFDGKDHRGVDESYPYPRHHLSRYGETKAEAERRVLAACDSRLFTTALRPHIVFGPRDTSLLPRLVERAKKGQLVRIGDGSNMIDVCYVDNAAEAHLAAAASPAAAGKAYFITQGEPLRLWPWIDELLAGLGLPPVKRSVPFLAAYALGAMVDTVHETLRLRGEPRLSRFIAAEMAHTHYYDISAAQRDLGWQPRVTTREGMTRLFAWWKSRCQVSGVRCQGGAR